MAPSKLSTAPRSGSMIQMLYTARGTPRSRCSLQMIRTQVSRVSADSQCAFLVRPPILNARNPTDQPMWPIQTISEFRRLSRDFLLTSPASYLILFTWLLSNPETSWYTRVSRLAPRSFVTLSLSTSGSSRNLVLFLHSSESRKHSSVSWIPPM